MSRKTFLVDAGRCTGCSLCVVACKDEHVGAGHAPWTGPQPDTGHFWIDVRGIERGRIPRVRMTHLPVMCQHCANAACVKACPEQAIKRRDDALVWIDSAVCTGCGLCREACPYGVVYMNAELGVAQKCTGCAHLVDEGSLPRCVDICPHEAIVFADDADEVVREARRADALEVYCPEYRAEPRVLWKGLPRPWIAGTVIDAASDEVLADAAITALDLVDDASVTVRSDAFGDFWVRGMAPDRKYRVAIGKAGYEAFLAIVTTTGDQDLGCVELKRTR